jgi:hypothetical protein
VAARGFWTREPPVLSVDCRAVSRVRSTAATSGRPPAATARSGSPAECCGRCRSTDGRTRRESNERRPYGVLDRHSMKRSALQPSCWVQSSDHGAPQSLDRRLRWRSAAWATEAEENMSVKQVTFSRPLATAPYRSLSIRGTRRSAKALLTAGVVGAVGVEPPAPSVSEGSGRLATPRAAPCHTTLPQLKGGIPLTSGEVGRGLTWHGLWQIAGMSLDTLLDPVHPVLKFVTANRA